MLKVLYFLLAGPLIITAKVADFLTWEILDTGWKSKVNLTTWPVNQNQAAYIQRLLMATAEEKRRSDELHGYYQKQLKDQDVAYRRQLRMREVTPASRDRKY